MKKLQMYFVSSCIAFMPSFSEAGRVDVLNCLRRIGSFSEFFYLFKSHISHFNY